jgi:oligopeptidase B
MKKINALMTILILVVMFSCSTQPAVKPPVAEKIPNELFDKRTDNYFWMRLSDEQKNAKTPDAQTSKVLEYLNKENEYSKTVLKSTEELQKKLYDEITGRIKKDDESVPYYENGFYYYNKYTEGTEYPVYYRKKGSLTAPEEILLDVNKLAAGKSYCSVNSLNMSRDNKILVYGVDFVSRRRYTLNFRDIQTGSLLPDRIENTTGQSVWAADNKTVFYVTKDSVTLRSNKIFRHKLGTPPEKDLLVYNEADETFSVNLSQTKSRKFILINSDQTLTTETRYIDASKPDADFKVFEPRTVNHEYSIDHVGNEFYIRTNIDGAANFKLMKTGETKTESSDWKEVIPHRGDILLENFELFDKWLVAGERIKGLNNLKIINLKDGSGHNIRFEEEAYTAAININPNPNTDLLRYSYSSLTTPNSVIDYNMATKEKKVLKEDTVLGGFNKDNYESKRLWAKAADGSLIPVSIVYKKGFAKDGKAPLLLYAYGSYGFSTDPGFRSAILSLLDRGFAYGLAHIRGGSEMGRYWYEDGKLLKKKNTFTDFNDCAQYLVNEKYTSSDRLFAMGGALEAF